MSSACYGFYLLMARTICHIDKALPLELVGKTLANASEEKKKHFVHPEKSMVLILVIFFTLPSSSEKIYSMVASSGTALGTIISHFWTSGIFS